MPVQCPECGTLGRDTDLTCSSCGTDLADDPVALVAGDVAAPARPRVRGTANRPAPGGGRRARIVGAAALATALVVTVAVLVIRDAGDGPGPRWAVLGLRLAPVPQPARVRVVGLGPDGELRLADLGTGRVRELRRAGAPVRVTTAMVRGDAIVMRTFDGHIEAVRDPARTTPRVRVLGRADAVAPSSDPNRLWLARASNVERVGTDGRPSARAELPTGYRLAGGDLEGDALLLASTTDATSIVWNPKTHSVAAGSRSGAAVAATSRVVVMTTCAPTTNTCRPLAVDLLERSTRALDAPVWDGFEPPVVVGRVAPGGNPAAFGEAFPGHHGVRASITLIDTMSGRVAWTHELAQSSSEPTAWDERGDLLFFTDGVSAFVHHVDGPADNVVRLGPVRQLYPVAVLPRAVPPTPARG